jgi:hypothetical protein
MPHRTIMGLVPTIQATQLLGENIRVAKKKKASMGDIVGLATKNIVGTGLIQAEAQIIGEL